ncbi:Na+/pantothenate symporter [Elusimicrobium minutum Pei191]|uniref:Na+/pantothenate symporter n=1 Tax=Elusimicrobium minutum (strain Pei191) TaxID=445932 RepID=B2KDV2_ELUMP|nr:sodium:solute symporter family protein [Elusimicrobium minutum]ACC98698.1 Na+/pantothenate symporter [Elusimicrobium minutum Pei191]
MKSSLVVYEYLSAADWFVFILILALTFGAAIYGHAIKGKNKGGVLEYMLMGRKLTLPMFVATLTATWYGGIFGVNEITFNYGIFNFITQGVFWYIAYIIFALFIVRKISKYDSVTLPELTGKMFGPKSAKTAAVFTFFYIMPIAYVLSIGMFLNMVLGISTLHGMIFGALFTCLYSAWGGFRAVVFSEIVQFVVMCSAVLIVVLFSVHAFGGISFLRAELPASHFSLTGGNSVLSTIIWGFIALATLVDPSFYQRCFAAKSTEVARKGILISTVIWICFDICTTLGALYARAVIPQGEPAYAYFFYAVQLLPVGLKGFFVAGILAIILSTLDSFMFIASNTLSYDFLRNKFKNVVLTNRIAMFAVSALCIALALLFKGSFKTIWLTLGSYMAACLLIPMLFGYVRPGKISDKLFCFSSITSALLMTLWAVTAKYHFELDGFYIGLLTSIIILSVSLIYGKQNAKSVNNL